MYICISGKVVCCTIELQWNKVVVAAQTQRSNNCKLLASDTHTNKRALRLQACVFICVCIYIAVCVCMFVCTYVSAYVIL